MRNKLLVLGLVLALALPGVAFAYPTSGLNRFSLCTPMTVGPPAQPKDHILFTAGVSTLNGVTYPGATGDFCKHYAALRGLLSSNLVGDLCSDPEWGSLCALLDPCNSDINGNIVVDDTASLTISVQGNGIPDASNELAVITTILANPSFDNGVLTYAEVLAAYEHNFYQVQCDMDAATLAGLSSLFPQTISGIVEILAAHITIGDGMLSVDNSDPMGPVYTANGSWGIAAGIVLVLCPLLEDPPFSATCVNPNLNQGDYMIIPELQPNGDADGDGAANCIEALAYKFNSCGSGSAPEQSTTYNCAAAASGTKYLDAVLNPAITPAVGSDAFFVVGDPHFVEEGGCITMSLESVYPTLDMNTVSVDWWVVPESSPTPSQVGETNLTLSACGVDSSLNGLYYCLVTYKGDTFPSKSYQLNVLPVGSVPVGGGIGMGLLAGACALAGALGLRRKS